MGRRRACVFVLMVLFRAYILILTFSYILVHFRSFCFLLIFSYIAIIRLTTRVAIWYNLATKRNTERVPNAIPGATYGSD